VEFHEAMPDKNAGAAGELVRRESLRLNPETDQWIEYATPKRYARDRVTRIDNSIDPIGVWYVDYRGYIARIPRLD